MQMPLRPPLRPNDDGPVVDLRKYPAGVVFTRTRLRITRDLSFAEWDELGCLLREFEGAIQWWIADWLAYGERVYGETYREAKAITKYEVQTLKNLVWVANKFEPSLRKDDVKFTHYAYAAGLEKETALAVIEEARTNRWRVQDTLSKVRAIRTDALFAQAREQALPADKYTVIVADPPWQYENGSVAPEDAPESRYATMSAADIAALPVHELAFADAMLFLWAPAPKLVEAFYLIEKWGFEYRTNMVWVKDRIGLGYYVRQQHEHLLIARRGAFPPPKECDRLESVFFAARGEHSQKPCEAFERIEQMYPGQRYLELFSRARRHGWDGWGFQHPGNIELPTSVVTVESEERNVL